MATQPVKGPGRQVCPLCALDDADLVSFAVEGPSLWRYTCLNHRPAFTWVTTGSATVDEVGGQGIAQELGVYDDLLTLFSEPGPFQEWGIVEHRYAERRPSVYRDVVSRYSHRALGSTQYSASAFLSLAASKLASQDHLALRFVPATGYWSYNGVISSFALAPATADTPVVTWEEFARAQGFDPLDWPALDFRHNEAPKARLVHEEPWRDALGTKWFRPDQLSFQGVCAWNHNATDLVAATRLVVTELRGVQDARACCEECYPSVLRYVGGSANA